MAVSSQMLPLGTRAPDFTLPDAHGKDVSLHDFDHAPGLLVAFLCQHCPYVQHTRQGIVELGRDLQARGIAVVGINANDWDAYPEDAPEHMAAEPYPFPYLVDASQEVAKAFGAVCTPDFFLFDGDRRLVYRGQLDDSRPGSGIPVTGADVRAAADALLAGRPVAGDQKPSVGCSIKWRPGNAPEDGR